MHGHTPLRTYLAATTFLIVTAIASAPARADGATGLAIGLRTGYALPAGKIGTTSDQFQGGDLSDSVTGMIPLWIDLGYRFTPNLTVGGFFQYRFGFLNKDNNRDCDGCSVHDLAFGATAQYHFMPGERFDPWAGL